MPGRALLIAAMLLAHVAGAACEVPEGGATLRVKNFGNAHFRDFTVSGEHDSADFHGAVCVEAADGAWRLRAEHVSVKGISGEGRELRLSAAPAGLEAGPWQFRAANLSADAERVRLTDASFSGGGVSGTAGELELAVTGGTAVATRVAAEGPGYRLNGASATFSGTALTVSAATFTTCTCPGEPAWTLTASEAGLELSEDGGLTLTGGRFNTRSLSVPLRDGVRLAQAEPAALDAPVSLEWDPAPPGRSRRGRGFSVLVPAFSLGGGSHLEFGITGLDAAHPLSGYFLLRAENETGSLLAGYTRGGGPRADVTVRQRLHEHLLLTFGFSNRHYPSQVFLHEAFATLQTDFPTLKGSGGSRFDWGATVTAALSSQIQPAGPVAGPRFRSALAADWRLPEGAAGRFRLRLGPEVTVYGRGPEQYGFRVRPAWSRDLGPATISVAHDRLFTNAASPFTKELDRLAPRSVSTAEISLSGQQLSASAVISARAAAAVDWLPENQAGFTDLRLEASLEGSSGDWNIRPHLQLQLADLVKPHGRADTKAFLEGGLKLGNGDVEFGIRSRQLLARTGGRPDLLELSAAWPFETAHVRFVPFIALDFVPLLLRSEAPAVTGHGLELDWEGCCGVLHFGYRVQDGEFTTSLSADFIRKD